MTSIEEVPDGGGMDMDLAKLEGQGATSADDMELVKLGKKPGMKRIYNFWTRTVDYVPPPTEANSADGSGQCVPIRS